MTDAIDLVKYKETVAEAATKDVLQENVFLKILKETPRQVFSCDVCKIFMKTYFEEHLPTIASAVKNNLWKIGYFKIW